MKPSDDTRIYIDCSYNGKFILPKGTSADIMSVLVNAIAIGDTYYDGRNILHPSTTDSNKRISVEIVSVDCISNFLDCRGENNQEYDIIISEVKSKLNNRNHAVVVFRTDRICVGSEEIKYVDLANPDIDPEEIINGIVEEALKNPGRPL